MTDFEPRRGSRVHAADGSVLVLDRELGRGGEGSVWTLQSRPEVVAKFYHKGLEPDRARKIQAMCRLRSASLLRVAAWPIDTVRSKPSGPPEGLLMPRISGYREAHMLYTPKSRRASFPEAQFPFILHACINIANAFATVHEAGQVIGDVNHGNLLISGEAKVALIDCDSFEISEGSAVFPCQVGVPTYTPPELQGRSFQGVRRTTQHDAFGLAVLIFHMLFLGRHPFAGIFKQGTEDKTIDDAIREYRFAWLPDNSATQMEPPPFIPRLREFPADLGDLFVRAFARSTGKPQRPAPQEWISSLESLSRSLRKCRQSEAHHYFSALTDCPWCRVENAFGRPVFGIRVAVIAGPDFDLVAIWSQIESIRPEPGDLAPVVTAYRLKPETRIGEIRKRRRKMRLSGIASMLLALLALIPGLMPQVLSYCILVIGFMAMRAFWRAGEESAREVKAKLQEVKFRFETDMRRWRKLEGPPSSFAECRRKLQNERQRLLDLPLLRTRRLAELKLGLRQKQLTRFLESHRIEDATIPNISTGRKALLRCYNVEDAADIDAKTIGNLNIRGFGPALKNALIVWRESVESKFVFDPNADVDPRDIHALDQELAQTRATLVRSLSAGPQQLRQALLTWQVERAGLARRLEADARELAQLQANEEALGRF